MMPACRRDPPSGPTSRALSTTLGRAFFDDPVMSWMLPDAELRRRKLHRLFESLTRHHHLARGGVEVAPDGSGIGRRRAVGSARPVAPDPRLEELRAPPSLLWSFGASLRRGLASSTR